ncbi:hypothetical protein OXX80_000998 [Metschnikowia pulcherrima]
MKVFSLLPVFLACSSALLLPKLTIVNDVDAKSPALKRADFANSEKPHTLQFNRRDGNSTEEGDDSTPQKYIVVFKEGHEDDEYEAHDDWVLGQFSELRKRGELDGSIDASSDDVEFFNISSFKGYSGYIPPTLLADIEADPLVDFVEPNSLIQVYETKTQNNAPYGLARVSKRMSAHPATLDYTYDTEGGKGVTAYVIDSGIKVEHPDFEGRAKWGSAIAPTAKVDQHGHGTHCAGTIGGKTFGIAKNVDLVAVRVLDQSARGYISDIIKGIEFAVKDHQAKVASAQKGYKGAAINLSLGAGASNALDQAANAAVNAGVHVVAAAGNENQNACNVSPARASGPITVGATDNYDTKASFSNWGRCVDIQAPGVGVVSAGISSSTQTMSGTSMSAPHVVGLIAYYLSLQPGLSSDFSAGDLITPAEMKRKLVAFGTKGVISGLDGNTPNVLAFNGAGEDLSAFWSL